jgi:hypothetical protein
VDDHHLKMEPQLPAVGRQTTPSDGPEPARTVQRPHDHLLEPDHWLLALGEELATIRQAAHQPVLHGIGTRRADALESIPALTFDVYAKDFRRAR